MLELLLAAAGFQPPETVTVVIDGPQVQERFVCELPCDVDRFSERETASEVTRDVSEGEAETEEDRGRKECIGDDCGAGTRKITFNIKPKRTLREGFSFSLDTERGKITLYDVVQHEGDPTGRSRISEFRFDRFPIEFTAHGHTVQVGEAERDTE